MNAVPQNQPISFYAAHADQIFSELVPFFKRIENLSVERFGQGFASKAAQDAAERFRAMLPELPDIGGKENKLTSNLITGAAVLCVYQVMSAQGKSLEEIGKLVYDAVVAGLPTEEALPDPREITIMANMHRHAEAFSEVNPYPFGWSAQFIEGSDPDFIWGVDYTSCGICKLFQQQDAAAFIPYVCFLDLPIYKSRGIGLVRTQTLAQGGEKCNFRFNLRGEYRLEWVPDFYQE